MRSIGSSLIIVIVLDVVVASAVIESAGVPL